MFLLTLSLYLSRVKSQANWNTQFLLFFVLSENLFTVNISSVHIFFPLSDNRFYNYKCVELYSYHEIPERNNRTAQRKTCKWLERSCVWNRNKRKQVLFTSVLQSLGKVTFHYADAEGTWYAGIVLSAPQ